MMTTKLFELEVENFRSIRGHMTVPLDAQVVLVHGENGAGKTSLLSAIELALTGDVQALRNADPGYKKQLIHRGAESGKVEIRVQGEAEMERFCASLAREGVTQHSQLDEARATFFTERSYLPQALLGQLLQIYQNSGTGIDSPLARFVARLLGLHRLDALEAGLKPAADVRNVRKIATRWTDTELELGRADRTIVDLARSRRGAAELVTAEIVRLADASRLLEISGPVSELGLEALENVIQTIDAEERLQQAIDRILRLDAVRREAESADNLSEQENEKELSYNQQEIAAALLRWREAHSSRLTALRDRVEVAFPSTTFPQGMADFRSRALELLRSGAIGFREQAARGAAEQARIVVAREERDVAQKQLELLDRELAQIGSNSEALGSALAEITSFIDGDTCPVCERDYGELGRGTLGSHVHEKVRRLSGAAERLLDISRIRSEQQLLVEQLDREIADLEVRQLNVDAELQLSRRSAEHDSLIGELDGLADIVTEGDRLEREDVALRRRLSERDGSDLARRAARETLTAFAREAGLPTLSEDEGLASAAMRLGEALNEQRRGLERRLSTRRNALDAIARARSAIVARDKAEQALKAEERRRRLASDSLDRAQALREDAQTIRKGVDVVRSAIIRREFNDRLNRVWRDLFVRLAPGEPFVPAFSVPKASTRRLQPKLVTHHRDGGRPGGTPGAMLSAGNLNTAALTLFLALHLAVPIQLPWLILDDPVQSMDDVHVAHLAALLKTLSKQHGRQLIVAVHDRQLFEYLKLELSPAQPEETLLAIELSRTHERDTHRLIDRLAWKEETALRAA